MTKIPSLHKLTFGIAYTSEPSGTEAAASGADVVRYNVIFGPLSCRRKLISVRGALGSGIDISIGACDASPLATAVAIVSCKCVVGVAGELEFTPHDARTYASTPRFLLQLSVWLHELKSTRKTIAQIPSTI